MSAKVDSAGISYTSRPLGGENAPKVTLKRKLAPVASAGQPERLAYPSPPMSIPPSPSGSAPPELPTTRTTSSGRPVDAALPPAPSASETVPHQASPTFFSPPTTSSSFDLAPGLPETIPQLERERGPSQPPTTPLLTGLTSASTVGASLSRSVRRSKTHVASACVNCKRAHLSCDVERPCARCIASGRQVCGQALAWGNFQLIRHAGYMH